MELTFEVPGRPQGKARPRATLRGGRVRVYTPEETATYENWIRLCFLRAHPDAPKLTGEIALEIDVWYAVPKSYTKAQKAKCMTGGSHPRTKPDGDNIQKAVADALNGVAYTDDAAIWSWKLQKHYGEAARLRVRLEGAQA